MNGMETALLIGLVSTGILSRDLPRAWAWLGAGSISFIASALYWRLALPHHPFFTLVCDWLVCYSIYSFGKEEWEMRLYNVFQLSVLVSLLKVAGLINPGDTYAYALEAINWIALLLVGGTSLLAGATDNGHRTSRGGHYAFHRALHPLRKARSSPPWHAKKH